MPTGYRPCVAHTPYRADVARPRGAKARADIVVERLAREYPGTARDLCALVHDGPVFAAGRGESVHPIHTETTCWVVLPFPFAEGKR